MGIDSNVDLRDFFKKTSNGFVQGNFSEHFLTLPHEEFLPKLDTFIEEMSSAIARRKIGLGGGLGHGVLKTTPKKTSKNLYKELEHPFKEWILKKKKSLTSSWFRELRDMFYEEFADIDGGVLKEKTGTINLKEVER